MWGLKLKQIKNQRLFLYIKNMVSTLVLFVFCFWSSIWFLFNLIFQCCVNWDLKLVILYEHLELNKKSHHWFGAPLYEKEFNYIVWEKLKIKRPELKHENKRPLKNKCYQRLYALWFWQILFLPLLV